MNKANLFVNILKYVPVSELNKESKLEFVTLNALKPDQFDNEDRRNLSSLLKRHTDSD